MKRTLITGTNGFLAKDHVGEIYGRLTVIGREGRTCKYICKCSCGEIVIVRSYNLTGGNTNSCGCLKKEMLSKRATKHGQKGTKEYNAWQAMLSRCRGYTEQSRRDYKNRGINFCQRWAKFENFFADMGKKPSVKHTLERRNNNKGYSKANCEWALRKVQGRNTRRNRIININGQKRCMSEWCEIYGMSVDMVKRRIYRGINPVVALTTPKKTYDKVINE